MTTQPHRTGLPTTAATTAPALNPNAIAKSISDAVNASISYQVEEMERLISSMNGLVNHVIQEGEKAEQRTRALEERISQFHAAIAKNEAVLVENEKRAAEANKALDLLRLAGENEQQEQVERNEIARRDRELKKELNLLSDEETAIKEKYDLKRQALHAGRQQYYPELDAELERITAELKSEKGEAEVKAPKLDKRRPVSPQVVNDNGKS